MLSKEELKSLGEEGIIPGPGESEKIFVKRLDILQKVKDNPSEFLKGKTFEKWNPDYRKIMGAIPKWILLTYSNQGLSPWQGAVMWVLEAPNKEKIPMIQLRKGFKKGRVLFYSRDEVLMHETLHAIRIGFNEPRFEEVFAYFHSKSKWRRFFGPLFRKPSHALFFISLIMISLLVQTSSLFFLTSPILPYLKVFTLLPLIDLTLRSAILIKDQRLLKKALRKLEKLFPNQKEVFSIAIRLKDAEIQKFATESIGELLSYIEKEVPKSIRWRQILAQFC